MIKLLIADDEPLVQIGLKSMLDWSSMNIFLCQTASNGEQAYQTILQEKPDIVLTDIKMPLMSGLELAGKCRQELGRLPVFIILTGYEDFQYAREALSYQAVDYLIKLELTPEKLEKSISSAIQIVEEYRHLSSSAPLITPDFSMFQERFFIRLINGLFESPAQFQRQTKEFQISFDAPGYMAASIRLMENSFNPLGREQKLTLNHSTLLMFQEMMSKYLQCRIVALDIQYFAVVLYIPQNHLSDRLFFIEQTLRQTFDMIYNYYSVTLFCTVGSLVERPMDISQSYLEAKQFIPTISDSSRIIFAENQSVQTMDHNVFNLSLFREKIREAFAELNTQALREIVNNIIGLLSQNRVHTAQATDAASTLLHLTINLLADGEQIASDIFTDEADGYQSLYRCTDTAQVIVWMQKLESGLVDALAAQKKATSNYLIESVKNYIASNIGSRLTLHDTALTFSISPNYLSLLFKKYTGTGFNEYVTQKKIDSAKELLLDSRLRIYEIADQLGFENAFYFSKVFKKYVGCSPRDYLARKQ